MFSLNRATILGNLTRDPELRYTPSGQAVANFSVATNRRWTGTDGQQQEAVEYHEIVTWGKVAELAQKALTKGKKVYVEGRLQTSQWNAPDGAKRQKTEIVAENLILISPKSGAGESFETESGPEMQAQPSEKKPVAKPEAKTTKKPAEEEIDLSDLPF